MANKYVKSFNFGGSDNYFPLPFVSAADNGKVLMVSGGNWGASNITPPPELIEFTVTNKNERITKTYQAPKNTTWAEWISSQYAGLSPYLEQQFSITSSNYVSTQTPHANNLYLVLTSAGANCLSSDVIVENEAYYCQGEK